MRKKLVNGQPSDQRLLVMYHIRKLREQSASSVNVCSEKLGVSPYQYYTWENGSRTPKQKNLQKFVDYYNVDLEYFTTPPDGWDEIKQKLLEAWRIKKGIPIPVANAASPAPNQPSENAPTVYDEATTQKSMEEVNSIIKQLLGKQLLAERGEIDPEKFIQDLRELKNYADFKLSSG